MTVQNDLHEAFGQSELEGEMACLVSRRVVSPFTRLAEPYGEVHCRLRAIVAHMVQRLDDWLREIPGFSWCEKTKKRS